MENKILKNKNKKISFSPEPMAIEDERLKSSNDYGVGDFISEALRLWKAERSHLRLFFYCTQLA